MTTWNEDDRVRAAMEKSGFAPSWENPYAGSGNWMYIPSSGLAQIFDAAQRWKTELAGIKKPWLCWCTDNDWCKTQQELVQRVGWTPVVGTDGRIAKPSLIGESVFIDFNKGIGTPKMRPHFPLEFAFLFAEKLAYWHSDILPTVATMEHLSSIFDGLVDGKIAGIEEKVSTLRRLKNMVSGEVSFNRIFELIGCTTAAASKSQFDEGKGWWRNVVFHPNAKSEIVKASPHWEFGVGVWLWAKDRRSLLSPIVEDLEPYHYSQISNKKYARIRDKMLAAPDRDKGQELSTNFDINAIRRSIGL